MLETGLLETGLLETGHPRVLRRRAVLVVLAIGALLCSAAPARASVDAGGAGPLSPGAWPVVPQGTYRPPVDGDVIDPFRAPLTPWGPGNRGLEYATVPGTPVRSIGAGEVVFAGQVGGRLAVTVLHPDGRRSSYSDLASIAVQVGELVPRGTVVGTSGRTLHLGLREGDRYVDPAAVFDGRRRAVLVPHRVSARSSPTARVVRRSEIGPMPS